MKMSKSSRHSKITGDFGESLVLYWLSKYGFECASVDHTGIDLIAKNPHTNELMGISVKSRCRNPGTENECITIPHDDFKKALVACNAFECVPYFAIVVDGGESIRAFLLSISHLRNLYPQKGLATYWKMSRAALQQYHVDPRIMHFGFTTQTGRWWNKIEPTDEMNACD
jgi:Holliday junction resolvase-like predicted endonuclease